MGIAEDLVATARPQLHSLLDLSGKILYSSASTLRKGPVYLLGHNPGGDPATHAADTIRASLDGLSTKKTNDYIDESWGDRPAGTKPLQRRVRWLLESLDLDPRSVAAANLLFPRSISAAGSGFSTFADICWPIHEAILEIVKPRVVLAFGNAGDSPYTFLRRRFHPRSEYKFPSGHGSWICRGFEVPSKFHVIGLPHLSRYDVIGHPDVVKQIRLISAL
jgi:hypothetical protein